MVLDSDKTVWQDDKTIQSTIASLKATGKFVDCIQPLLLNDKKTDYNDLAQRGKQIMIQRMVCGVFNSLNFKRKSIEITDKQKKGFGSLERRR